MFKNIIVTFIASLVAVLFASWLLAGFAVEDFTTAVLFAVVLGLANAIVKPVLKLLTLPINVLTLGLFSIVLNALIILGVSFLVQGATVDGFISAIVLSIVLGIVNMVVSAVLGKD